MQPHQKNTERGTSLSVLSGVPQTNVITTDVKPLHLARTEGAESEEEKVAGVRSAYVDLLLLARARCLIAGRSGFTHIASLLANGYDGCYTILKDLPTTADSAV